MSKEPRTRSRLSREVLLPRLAAHVLESGLAGASLRPLAKAAGTSDRMLIYHFGSKERLVAELLEYLAAMFADALDDDFPSRRSTSRQACAADVLAVTSRPQFRPFMRVWWEIVAGSAGGDEVYRASAGSIMDTLLRWVVDHLPEDDPDPQAGARAVLTVIEGAQMLDAIGRADIGKGALSAL